MLLLGVGDGVGQHGSGLLFRRTVFWGAQVPLPSLIEGPAWGDVYRIQYDDMDEISIDGQVAVISVLLVEVKLKGQKNPNTSKALIQGFATDSG